MELSFSYYTWIAMLKNQPYMLIFLIGFGMPFLIAMISGFVGPLIPENLKKAATVLGIIPIIITWLIGFLVTVAMTISEIAVIHILLSILVIYLSALMFCIVNLNILVNFLVSFKDASFMTKTITCINTKSLAQSQNTGSSKSRRRSN